MNHLPTVLDDHLIEGIVTTLNPDRTTNIAPMGPIVDREFGTILLRPYRTSSTYQNLNRTGEGVFHITDDVELLARTAIGEPSPECPLIPARDVAGAIIADACRWYAFRVESIDDQEDRTRILATIVGQGRLRDFLGFNRAKHAVVEAAILATRVSFLPADEITAEFRRLAVIVDKTGAHPEHRALALLREHVSRLLPDEFQDLGRPK